MIANQVARTMTGVVLSQGRWFVVDCPEAPIHLRPLYLTASQMNGAAVGDTVRLAYHVTSRSGLWSVVEVMR